MAGIFIWVEQVWKTYKKQLHLLIKSLTTKKQIIYQLQAISIIS